MTAYDRARSLAQNEHAMRLDINVLHEYAKFNAYTMIVQYTIGAQCTRAALATEAIRRHDAFT
jgi:hypothetical protein